MSEPFPQNITHDLIIPFPIKDFGLYAIKIVARCKSKSVLGLQDSQDLRIEIDDIKFREIPAKDKPQYNNIPPSWNGTDLRGLAKTIFFILPLNKGPHNLKFVPTHGAHVESLEVTSINNIRELTFEPNDKAEDGDKRPWYTFAFINLPLMSIQAEVSVSWHFLDGDDIKLIIDDQIEKNNRSKLWKNWVWSARPWNIFSELKRELKIFNKNLPSGIHYVEFWVDRTPTLHQVSFSLGDYILKRIPTAQDPEWTGDFQDDTDEILLARLIFGESENQSRKAKIWTGGSVLNRVNAPAWPDTIQKVILQKGQYDPFKVSDTNYEKIKNPLDNASKQRVDAWNESAKIARQLISGEIHNPTTATHFHGIGVTREWFIDHVVPQGKFLKRIDDTYFYWSPN